MLIRVKAVQEGSGLHTMFHIHNRTFNNICILWPVLICITRSGP